MKRRTPFAFLLVTILLAAPASRAIQSGATPSAPASTVSIPFELVTRHIMLKVKINNSRPLSFVLDTGDRVGIVDAEVAKELGLKLQGHVNVGGAGSETLPGSLVQDANWTIPGLEGFSQPVRLALPLGRLAARFGHDFDGIIGSDFIKQFVVEVDYQARVVRLHDKDKFSYSGPGESIPIQLNQLGYPIVEAEVTPIGSQPIKGKFVLDLGSGGSLTLHSPFVAEHKLLSSDLKTIRAIGVGGAGGASTGQIGRVAELKIGKFRLSNPNTMFSEDKAGALASTALAGNIGQRVAGRFKLFLDYNHDRIVLEPAPNFSEPFDRAQSGLALSADDKEHKSFRVMEVLENSPATEGGLQKDDIIVGVDDKQASELTLTSLNELFETPLTRKLTIRRGDRTLQIRLTPRKLV
jgi:Aspartyl protease/PDZ domain